MLSGLGLLLTPAAARAAWRDPGPQAARGVVANPMGVTQASFRRRFRQGMKVAEFPGFLREKVGIPRVCWSGELLGPLQGDAVRSLRASSDAAGLRSLLLDPGTGPGLATLDAGARKAVLERLKPWLERAATLGCIGVSLDLRGEGSYDEQYPRALEGLVAAMPVLKASGLQGVIQSLGGMTSQGNFVAALLNKIGDPAIRAEPSFNSWHVTPSEDFSRATGLRLLSPLAACVLADYTRFDDKGDSMHFPTQLCMRVVRSTDFRGPVVVHYDGLDDELEGVLKAKAVLMRNEVQP
jgi:L-ribulose-5-phosphate 3-epimerase